MSTTPWPITSSCRPSTPWPARRRPRIVLGDFNLHPDEVLPTTTAEGYDLVLSAPTFPNLEPKVQIDYAVLGGLVARDVEVVSTRISDHRALVVDVAAVVKRLPWSR